MGFVFGPFFFYFNKTLLLRLLLFCRKASGYNLKRRKKTHLQEKPQTTLVVLPLGFLQLCISLLLIRAAHFSWYTKSVLWYNTACGHSLYAWCQNTPSKKLFLSKRCCMVPEYFWRSCLYVCVVTANNTILWGSFNYFFKTHWDFWLATLSPRWQSLQRRMEEQRGAELRTEPTGQVLSPSC